MVRSERRCSWKSGRQAWGPESERNTSASSRHRPEEGTRGSVVNQRLPMMTRAEVRTAGMEGKPSKGDPWWEPGSYTTGNPWDVEGDRVEGRSDLAGNIEGSHILEKKRSEPHGRLRDATSPRRSSGASRRSRVERQGRNESGRGRSRPKGESGTAHAWIHELLGVDARSVCRRRGSLWTTP